MEPNDNLLSTNDNAITTLTTFAILSMFDHTVIEISRNFWSALFICYSIKKFSYAWKIVLNTTLLKYGIWNILFSRVGLVLMNMISLFWTFYDYVKIALKSTKSTYNIYSNRLCWILYPCCFIILRNIWFRNPIVKYTSCIRQNEIQIHLIYCHYLIYCHKQVPLTKFCRKYFIKQF